MSNTPLSLAEKKFIEKHSELGYKSPAIAKMLGRSVWIIRKCNRHQKKD